MRSQKVTGIILSRINYKETDKIVILFSKELGKILLKAKGAKSIKSHRLSHFEPLNLISVLVYESVLTETKIIETFLKIKADLGTLGLGFYVCEVLNRILPEHEPHKKTFEKLLILLQDLNEKSLKNFLVEMLWDMGYLPVGQYPKRGINVFVESVIERRMNSKSLLLKINQ